MNNAPSFRRFRDQASPGFLNVFIFRENAKPPTAPFRFVRSNGAPSRYFVFGTLRVPLPRFVVRLSRFILHGLICSPLTVPRFITELFCQVVGLEFIYVKCPLRVIRCAVLYCQSKTLSHVRTRHATSH